MSADRVTASRLLVLATVAMLIATGCGSSSTTVPPSGDGGTTQPPAGSAAAASAASSTTTGSGSLADVQADAIAHAGEPVADPAVDVIRERLLVTMGVPASLGADADRILSLVAASEAAARSKIVPFSGLGTARAPGGADGEAVLARFPAFNRLKPVHDEFQPMLVEAVHRIGQDGPQTAHGDEGSVSATEVEGSLSGTTQMHPTVDVTFSGSDVKVSIFTDIQNTVTDTKTGYTVFTESVRDTLTGEIDACPSPAGLVPGSIDADFADDASAFGGPGGVDSHATAHVTRASGFQGTVDDQANLGQVSQTYTEDKQFKRTTSVAGKAGDASEGAYTFTASGIEGSSPGSDSGPATIGDWSKATMESTESGDVTAQMTKGISGNAGSDEAIARAVYSAAQTGWRDSRCVIVTAPTYIPRSQFDHNGRPTHTEEVEKGSTTLFETGVDHRFGQKVVAPVTAKLDGKESLSPDRIDTPPGQLTYTAPDEDGQDGVVQLESVSRQGIGRLKLTFHTGERKFKVSLDGKMTTSAFGVSYVTTMHVPAMLLTRTADPPRKSADGNSVFIQYAGSGPATATVLLGIADCRKPYTVKGTMKLRAEHEMSEDQTYDPKWTVTFDPSTTFSFQGGSCAGASIESFVGTGDAGPVPAFMMVLGPVDFRSPGEDARVRHTTKIGVSTNVIDATMKGHVVTGTGQ